jgi:hypothetical protein
MKDFKKMPKMADGGSVSYEQWQNLNNAYRKKPTEETKKAAYDAFDSYREAGIKEANKLTPSQEKAKQVYLGKVAAEHAEIASGNKNMKEAEMNMTGYDYKKSGGKVKRGNKKK